MKIQRSTERSTERSTGRSHGPRGWSQFRMRLFSHICPATTFPPFAPSRNVVVHEEEDCHQSWLSLFQVVAKAHYSRPCRSSTRRVQSRRGIAVFRCRASSRRASCSGRGSPGMTRCDLSRIGCKWQQASNLPFGCHAPGPSSIATRPRCSTHLGNGSAFLAGA